MRMKKIILKSKSNGIHWLHRITNGHSLPGFGVISIFYLSVQVQYDFIYCCTLLLLLHVVQHIFLRFPLKMFALYIWSWLFAFNSREFNFLFYLAWIECRSCEKYHNLFCGPRNNNEIGSKLNSIKCVCVCFVSELYYGFAWHFNIVLALWQTLCTWHLAVSHCSRKCNAACAVHSVRADVFRSGSIKCGGWWAMCSAFPSCLSTCVVPSTEDVNLFRRCRHISAAKQFQFFSLSNGISLTFDVYTVSHVFIYLKNNRCGQWARARQIVFSYHQHLITTS